MTDVPTAVSLNPVGDPRPRRVAGCCGAETPANCTRYIHLIKTHIGSKSAAAIAATWLALFRGIDNTNAASQSQGAGYDRPIPTSVEMVILVLARFIAKAQ